MIIGDNESGWESVDPYTGEEDNSQPQPIERARRPLQPLPPFDPVNNPEDERELNDLKSLSKELADDIKTRLGNETYTKLLNVPYTVLRSAAATATHSEMIRLEAAMQEGANTTEKDNLVRFDRNEESIQIVVPYIVDDEISQKFQQFKSTHTGEISGVRTEYRVEGKQVTKNVYIPVGLIDNRAIAVAKAVTYIPLVPTRKDIEHMGGAITSVRYRFKQSDDAATG